MSISGRLHTTTCDLTLGAIASDTNEQSEYHFVPLQLVTSDGCPADRLKSHHFHLYCDINLFDAVFTVLQLFNDSYKSMESSTCHFCPAFSLKYTVT